MPADGPAPSGAEPSAGIVMTKLGSCINFQDCYNVIPQPQILSLNKLDALRWPHGFCKFNFNLSRLICIRLVLGHINLQGLCSLCSKTSYHQILSSLEAMRLHVVMIVELWNLAGISPALLPRCPWKFRAIGKVYIWISRLRDFTRSCGKTSIQWIKAQRNKVKDDSDDSNDSTSISERCCKILKCLKLLMAQGNLTTMLFN